MTWASKGTGPPPCVLTRLCHDSVTNEACKARFCTGRFGQTLYLDGTPYLDHFMKPFVLSTVVGGLVLFFWQFLSFAAINLHGPAQEYTPLDREILAHLDALNLEQGMYALGSPSPEERADPEGLGAEYMARMEGQPYGVLNYQHEWRGDMTPNLIRSMFMNLLAAALISWLLSQAKHPTILKCALFSIAIGFAGFIFYPYSNFIWFKNPDIVAHLIDAIVPFALVGVLNHLLTPSS